MMLRPTKHSHPDRTVVNVALILLRRLMVRRVESYDELLRLAREQVKGGDILFMPALNFLYLLGLVEYLPKIDSLEYVGRQ